MAKYDSSSIVEMSQLDHVRNNSSMYIGDSEDATRLLEEVLDNSLDEVQGGHASVVGVLIDTDNGVFKVLDSGRGFPFDQNLPIEKDPPVLACTKLFTSGKFQKGSKDSAYEIAVGLHGIGLVACYALSDYMTIDIYRNKIHATYNFKEDGVIERTQEIFNGKDKPYSTKIEVKPSKKYFNNIGVNISKIEERLYIAAANYPNLKIALMINGKDKKIIHGSEDDLIKKYIGESVKEWFDFKHEKKPESYNIKFGWDEEPPSITKCLTTVNLCKVTDGSHINYVLNSLKKFFMEVGQKNKYTFQNNDCFVGFRLYMNLKVIKAAYAEQVKDRLSSRTDLSILNNFDECLNDYFKKNKEKLIELLDRFQSHRNDILHKKIVVNSSTGKKRGLNVLTRLVDCKNEGGELIICEGASAAGGLIETRDVHKHAILPLRGVTLNTISTTKDLFKNDIIKDIIIACGCGVDDNCDVNKLRYSKIIVTADADPAGEFITTLLLSFFAYKMKPVVQENKLFVCKTPLFGYKDKSKFHPLWDETSIEEARKLDKKILRFKGLGGFNPNDLKVFVFDESFRKLLPVVWSEKHHKQIFELLSDPDERKKLVMGEWVLNENNK